MGILAFVFVSLVSFVVRIHAMQPPAAQSEYVPANQLPPGEQLPAAPLLIAAYMFVALAIVFYAWTIGRRLNKVEAEMRALERRKAERSPTR